MLCLDSSLALERLPLFMRTRPLTNNAGGRATPTAASVRKLGPRLHSQYYNLSRRLHTAARTSAQLRESNESMAAPPAAADEEDILQAAADALDPERTSASLGYTWLTHWQLVEEDRRFRQLVFQNIRGRQQQRQQQIFDLLGVPEASTTTSGSEEAAYNSDAEVRIVHGRLSVVPGTSEEQESLSFSSSSPSSKKINSSNVAPAAEEEDGVDDLTWLASHPEAEAAELSLTFNEDTSSSSTSSASNSSTNEIEAATAIRAATSGSSSGGSLAAWPVARTPTRNSSTTSSASTNFTSTATETEAEAAREAVLPGAVQLRLGAEVATVRPLWISIYLEESTGVAKLFESVVPLQSEVLEKMSIDLTPFCSVSGLEFGAFADLRYGPWLNYFVGLVGDVAVEEADILWPNQVLHRDRVLYNVRGAGDVARFLADPRKEDEAHVENLKRLAEERGYRKGWCWYMLRSRWGQGVLKSMGIDPAKM